MNYDPEKHHRKSISIPGYDYSQNGHYFVTICVQNKECIFGKINDGKMILNDIGKIIDLYWNKSLNHFKNIELDKYQIMPNHMHGIIVINNIGSSRGEVISPLQISEQCPTLGKIIAYFKYQSTKHINQIRKIPGIKLWQRNYYEHVIRNENDLYRIRQYIEDNPLKWENDKYYF